MGGLIILILILWVWVSFCILKIDRKNYSSLFMEHLPQLTYASLRRKLTI